MFRFNFDFFRKCFGSASEKRLRKTGSEKQKNRNRERKISKVKRSEKQKMKQSFHSLDGFISLISGGRALTYVRPQDPAPCAQAGLALPIKRTFHSRGRRREPAKQGNFAQRSTKCGVERSEKRNTISYTLDILDEFLRSKNESN